MVFSKKWLQNHPKFLLHFLIHIDVLMLCRKFKLIPTNNFQVMIILKLSLLYNRLLDSSVWCYCHCTDTGIGYWYSLCITTGSLCTD